MKLPEREFMTELPAVVEEYLDDLEAALEYLKDAMDGDCLYVEEAEKLLEKYDYYD